MHMVAPPINQSTLFQLIGYAPDNLGLFYNNPYGSDILDEFLVKIVTTLYEYYTQCYFSGDLQDLTAGFNLIFDHYPICCSEFAEDYADFVFFDHGSRTALNQTDKDYYARMDEFTNRFKDVYTMFEFLFTAVHTSIYYLCMEWFLNWSHQGHYFIVAHSYIKAPQLIIQFTQASFSQSSGLYDLTDLSPRTRTLYERSLSPSLINTLIPKPYVPHLKGDV